jgi:tetratricopeptide (TPR) repeat protein
MHFLVDSDLERAEIEPIIATLERTRALVLRALVDDQVEIPGHVRILAVTDTAYFRELVGEFVGGYFGLGYFDEPTILIPVDALRGRTATVAHELAHAISSYLFPVQPRWFAEGLAQFVERVDWVGIGAMPMQMGWVRWGAFPLSAADVLAWNGDIHGGDARFHLWSFVLYHWLWSTHGKQFTAYQKDLATNTDPKAAWESAFPEFDATKPDAMAKLDRSLQAYRSTEVPVYRVEAEGDSRYSEIGLASVDAHLFLNKMRLHRSGASKDAKEAARVAELAQIYAEDPDNALAFVALYGLSAASPDAMRAFVSLRPRDWRAWLVLAYVTVGAEQENALRRAVDLNPESAYGLNSLAWNLVASGRPHEALPLANRALDLAPWSAPAVDTLAEVAFQLGKCVEALQLQRRSVRMPPGNKDLSDHLRKIEKQCASASNPAAVERTKDRAPK